MIERLDLSEGRKIINRSLSKIADGCRNLKALELSNCHNVSDRGVIEIADCYPKLLELHLPCDDGHPCISNDSVIKIAEGYLLLRGLDLCRCGDISDVSLIKIAEGCHMLRILDLSFCIAFVCKLPNEKRKRILMLFLLKS
jgi:hypothetical protein